MYDFYSQKSNYPFKGTIYNRPRYFTQDTTISIGGQTKSYKSGEKNPWFKIGGEDFMFNITSTNTIDKKQPITNFLIKSEVMNIDTKFKTDYFVQGGYIEANGKLWIIKAKQEEKGPNKSVYGFFTINPLSTSKMILEEVVE